eukprot:snap_masked-scaffold_72-processed-gene-0.17-mRNA-1 protein AED:1.00 eAED:1.00 QI:0/0/0/0/1/1/2/0/73
MFSFSLKRSFPATFLFFLDLFFLIRNYVSCAFEGKAYRRNKRARNLVYSQILRVNVGFKRFQQDISKLKSRFV